MKRRSFAGFTLLDLIIAMGIVGILAAISIVLYNNYLTRARASDIVVKYDAARSTVGANIAGDSATAQCSDVLRNFGAPAIPDDHASIAYGFEAVSSGNATGYRPVLTVCATADKQGANGVKVAQAAHDELAKSARIEGGAVLTDTMVSFALPLTDANRVVCSVAPPAQAACGSPATKPVQPSAQSIGQPPAQALTQVPAQTATQTTTQTQSTTDDDKCNDAYGGDCKTDFPGVCDVSYVQEVCRKTCGVCQ